MGGSGSGRYAGFGTRNVADTCQRLDVNWLHRTGRLEPGVAWHVHWTRGSHPAGSVSGYVESLDRLTLLYRYRTRGAEWENVREPVRLVYTACHFGGRRPWFVCPGVRSGTSCGRRVGSLYCGGKWFLCRHCYGLAYQSQRDDAADRLLSKAQNFLCRLGGSGSLGDLPPKPKGMHWRTYQRLMEAERRAELEAWRRMAERLHPN